MTLYRLEHEQTQDGMWTVQVAGKPIVEHLTDKRLANLPMPFHERYRYENKIWRCAVGDLVAMHAWFSEQDIKEMIAFGFKMIQFESDDFIIEPNQILFNCHARQNQIDITAQFLERKL